MTTNSRPPSAVYVCPMHPEVRRSAPGCCPECGMALVPQAPAPARHEGHGSASPGGHAAAPGKHEGHSLAAFARKFWVSLALTVPVVAYSDLPERLFSATAPAFPGSGYVGLVLGSIVFFYGGLVFLQGAVREVRARLPGMMTLIAVAITAAYLFSVFASFAGEEGELFWELTTLITVMLLGHWLEMRAVQGTQSALKELAKLMPDTVEIVSGDGTRTVPLTELKENDLFIVRPGGKVAADGTVETGESDVDESAVTGESRPVPKAAGAEVIAGTVNGDGSLTVRATKIGDRTFLAGVMRLVAEAQSSRSRLQMLSDKAAFVLTVIAIVAGGVTLAVWLVYADAVFAVARMVAVLVVACPHALGLAVPLVASISTTLAARNGFLVKQRLALEAAREIEIVLFDKTGTLTKGEYGVTDVWCDGIDEAGLLGLAAAVNASSEHVVGRAIVRRAKERGVAVRVAEAFERVPGKGVKAVIEGQEVLVGGANMRASSGNALSAAIERAIAEESRKGKTVIYVIRAGRTLGAIALADVIRDESREAIAALKAIGVRVGMITGDSEDVAAWVARELGIDDVFARVLPDEKESRVRELQAKGMRVAMVGDGINDAPALTRADLGVAIGAGTNVAIESAGIILVRNDPRDVVKVIRLSRATFRKMIENLFWATGYNVVALPLAAGVLASRGIILEPALAAAFMSASTIIVAANAVTLRRMKLA